MIGAIWWDLRIRLTSTKAKNNPVGLIRCAFLGNSGKGLCFYLTEHDELKLG